MGKSIPILRLLCIRGVLSFGLPKINIVVGGRLRPTFFASSKSPLAPAGTQRIGPLALIGVLEPGVTVSVVYKLRRGRSSTEEWWLS